MPVNIFFAPDENGRLHLETNGGKIFPSQLQEARDVLDSFIESLTPEYVKENNEAVDRYYEEQLNISYIKEPKPKIRGFLYLIESNGLHKIGRTKQLAQRFRAYTTENPHGAKMIASVEVDDYVKREKDLLDEYKDFQYRGNGLDSHQKSCHKFKLDSYDDALNRH